METKEDLYKKNLIKTIEKIIVFIENTDGICKKLVQHANHYNNIKEPDNHVFVKIALYSLHFKKALCDMDPIIYELLPHKSNIFDKAKEMVKYTSYDDFLQSDFLNEQNIESHL